MINIPHQAPRKRCFGYCIVERARSPRRQQIRAHKVEDARYIEKCTELKYRLAFVCQNPEDLELFRGHMRDLGAQVTCILAPEVCVCVLCMCVCV